MSYLDHITLPDKSRPAYLDHIALPQVKDPRERKPSSLFGNFFDLPTEEEMTKATIGLTDGPDLTVGTLDAMGGLAMGAGQWMSGTAGAIGQSVVEMMGQPLPADSPIRDLLQLPTDSVIPEVRVLQQKDRIEAARAKFAGSAYQPKTELGRAGVEAASKVIDLALRPVKGPSEALKELYYPLGVVFEGLVEFYTFKAAHAVGSRAKTAYIKKVDKLSATREKIAQDKVDKAGLEEDLKYAQEAAEQMKRDADLEEFKAVGKRRAENMRRTEAENVVEPESAPFIDTGVGRRRFENMRRTQKETEKIQDDITTKGEPELTPPDKVFTSKKGNFYEKVGDRWYDSEGNVVTNHFIIKAAEKNGIAPVDVGPKKAGSIKVAEEVLAEDKLARVEEKVGEPGEEIIVGDEARDANLRAETLSAAKRSAAQKGEKITPEQEADIATKKTKLDRTPEQGRGELEAIVPEINEWLRDPESGIDIDGIKNKIKEIDKSVADPSKFEAITGLVEEMLVVINRELKKRGQEVKEAKGVEDIGVREDVIKEDAVDPTFEQDVGPESLQAIKDYLAETSKESALDKGRRESKEFYAEKGKPEYKVEEYKETGAEVIPLKGKRQPFYEIDKSYESKGVRDPFTDNPVSELRIQSVKPGESRSHTADVIEGRITKKSTYDKKTGKIIPPGKHTMSRVSRTNRLPDYWIEGKTRDGKWDEITASDSIDDIRTHMHSLMTSEKSARAIDAKYEEPKRFTEQEGIAALDKRRRIDKEILQNKARESKEAAELKRIKGEEKVAESRKKWQEQQDEVSYFEKTNEKDAIEYDPELDSERTPSLKDDIYETLDFSDDIGGGERGSLGGEKLRPEKMAAYDRIKRRAQRAGKSFKAYLRDLPMTVETKRDLGTIMEEMGGSELKRSSHSEHTGRRAEIREGEVSIDLEKANKINKMNPKNETIQHMRSIKRIVDDYVKGSFKVPKSQKPTMSTGEIKPSGDIKRGGGSPHNTFRQVFDHMTNPVIDAFESLGAALTNTVNGRKFAADLLRDVPDGMKDINKTLLPIYEKYRSHASKRDSLYKARKVIKEQIKKTSKENPTMIEKLKQELKENADNLDKNKANFKDLTGEYDGVIGKLAKDNADIRIALDAGGELPEGVKLNIDEQFISDKLKEYMEQKKTELTEVGIPTVKDRPYMTHLWGDVVGKTSKYFPKFRKTPVSLRFMKQMPDSRIWIPSARKIMDTYIPTVNRKLAYQPFLNRWSKFARSTEHPKLGAYMREWIDLNLNRTVKPWERVANGAIAIEYARLIGASLSVGYKHSIKLSQTLALHDTFTMAQALATVPKIPIQAAMKKLGWRGEAKELQLYRAYSNQRMLVRMLDENPTLKFSNHYVKRVLSQPVMAIEAFENGVNVLAGIISGRKKGMDPAATQRAIWDTIFDANHRGSWDQPLMLKSTGARMATMFQVTPFKMMEYKWQMIKGAARGQRDAFGTHYGTRLIRFAVTIGVAESIARRNDTSILNIALFHIPFLRHDAEGNFSIAESPLLQLAGSDPEGVIKHFIQGGMPGKAYNMYEGKFPKKYYDSSFKYLMGMPSTKEKGGFGSKKKKKKPFSIFSKKKKAF